MSFHLDHRRYANFKFQLRYINPMEITSKFGDTIYLTTKSTSCLHIF